MRKWGWVGDSRAGGEGIRRGLRVGCRAGQRACTWRASACSSAPCQPNGAAISTSRADLCADKKKICCKDQGKDRKGEGVGRGRARAWGSGDRLHVLGSRSRLRPGGGGRRAVGSGERRGKWTRVRCVRNAQTRGARDLCTDERVLRRRAVEVEHPDVESTVGCERLQGGLAKVRIFLDPHTQTMPNEEAS